ncbi:MAG: hypothetical protein AAGD32_17075 [Planctomycetota bacterium]
MKWIFLVIFGVLTLCSYWIYATLPEQETSKPVIYWVTDRNPARNQQVDLFHDWMAKNHPDKDVLLLLDMGNRDGQKQIIQGVSGVGADVQDTYHGVQVRLYHSMGIVEHLTEQAKELGFGLDQTYPALATELTVTVDGETEQVAFPCNVANARYIFNEGLLREVGFPAPPESWTIEKFEAYGKAFVEKANADNPTRRRFVARDIPLDVLYRSYGIDLFNETLTGAGIDDYALTPDGLATERGYVRALELTYKWQRVDRIMPTASEIAAMNTEGGYGGAALASFERGDFLISNSGRWELIKMRETNKLRVRRLETKLDGLADAGYPRLRDIWEAQGVVALFDEIERLEASGVVFDQALRPDPLADGPLVLNTVQYPYRFLPNAALGTRAAVVYTGSDHKELATLFLAFLASEEYNANIVADADGLPPNPAYTDSEAFLRPAEDPDLGVYSETEWKLHEAWLDDVQGIAIGKTYSPYVLYREAERELGRPRDEFYEGIGTVERAADLSAARLDRLIATNVSKLEPDDPLRDQYAEGLETQKKIDALKAAGKPIPAEWISNPFFTRYYREIGMLDESGSAIETPAVETETH